MILVETTAKIDVQIIVEESLGLHLHGLAGIVEGLVELVGEHEVEQNHVVELLAGDQIVKLVERSAVKSVLVVGEISVA